MGSVGNNLNAGAPTKDYINNRVTIEYQAGSPKKEKPLVKTKIPRTTLVKVLNDHSVNIQERDDGHILAGGVYDKSGNEIFTDVTKYSMKKLREFLGY